MNRATRRKTEAEVLKALKYALNSCAKIAETSDGDLRMEEVGVVLGHSFATLEIDPEAKKLYAIATAALLSELNKLKGGGEIVRFYYVERMLKITRMNLTEAIKRL